MAMITVQTGLIPQDKENHGFFNPRIKNYKYISSPLPLYKKDVNTSIALTEPKMGENRFTRKKEISNISVCTKDAKIT